MLVLLERFVKLVLKGNIDAESRDLANTLLAKVEGRCDWNAAEPHLVEMIDAYARPDITAQVIEIRARDFMHELQEYPTWAVLKALRWWKGHENTYRYRAPLPGDIAQACYTINGIPQLARRYLKKFEID